MLNIVSLGIHVFRQASDFLKTTAVTPPLAIITKALAELDMSIARLSAHAVEQETSNRAYHATAAQVKVKARELRREYLRPIANAGESLLENDPILRQTLAMPDGRSKEHLFAATYAVAKYAGERVDRFVEAGFAPDFVDQVKKVAVDLQHTIDLKASHMGHRAAATSGMKKEIRKGKKLLRLLDSVVRPWLEKNMPERVAEWESLTRFVRPGAANTPVVPVTPVTPVPPVPPVRETPQSSVSTTPETGEAHVA